MFYLCVIILKHENMKLRFNSIFAFRCQSKLPHIKVEGSFTLPIYSTSLLHQYIEAMFSRNPSAVEYKLCICKALYQPVPFYLK
jgi:hypothetical protein